MVMSPAGKMDSIGLQHKVTWPSNELFFEIKQGSALARGNLPDKLIVLGMKGVVIPSRGCYELVGLKEVFRGIFKIIRLGR